MRFLSPTALRSIDQGALDALLDREECVVAAADGEVRGLAAAALLRADYAVLARDATIELDSDAARAAAEWRGASVADGVISAPAALTQALCDEIIEGDPHTWFTQWLGSRHPDALDAAALLLRQRGGDAKEREVFADLFARGVPQAGLRAFLSRNA